jgi:hypothetical protein
MLDQLGRGFPGVHFVGAYNPLGKYFQRKSEDFPATVMGIGDHKKAPC